jgi:carbonic anhydrase
MTSCTATAPIDLPTKGTVNPIAGTFNCVYDADMCSGASVTVSDDRSHLSVNCGGGSKSNISFYGTVYVPSEIRMYAPSLHTYNGARADAEILIVHTPGSNAKTDGLIVSVPVSITGSNNSDLAAIIQAANTINVNTLALNASAPINYAVNVNNLVPAKPYCVYYGTLPYDSCGGNYYYAAFTDPVSGAGSLSTILVDSGIATVQPSMTTNLQKSNAGPITGLGSQSSTDEYVLFELVGNDCNDDDDVGASKSNGTASANDSQPIGMNIVWGLILAVALLGIWYVFMRDANAAPATVAAPDVASAPNE